MKVSLLILVAFVLFVVLDLVWFKFAGNFFKAEAGSILRLSEDGAWQVNFSAAMMVYVFMAIGTIVFVLPLGAGIFHQTLFFGALFGLLTFGIFDFTNLSIVSAWTIRFALVDMAWGVTVNAAVASCMYIVSRVLFPHA